VRTNWLGWLLGVCACTFAWRLIRLPAHPSVQVVYLVPSDSSPKPEFAEGARRAMIAAQRWYFDELKSGVTFTLAVPLVRTIQTRHPQSWYSSSTGKNDDREALWSAAVNEAFGLTGGSYNDPEHIWLYVLDADLPKVPAQGTSGVALLLGNEVSSVVGLEPDCSTVGTIVHELGHAFGLKHPPDCDAHRKDDSDPECQSMSYLGGFQFPFAQFMPDEREKFLRSSAFATAEPTAANVQCSR